MDLKARYEGCLLGLAAGSFLRKEPPQIVGSGYVVQSLEAALWAFSCAENFRDGCLRAVNLGYDADATAAIYGQPAGAFYGVESIPAEWRACLVQADLIAGLARELFEKGAHP